MANTAVAAFTEHSWPKNGRRNAPNEECWSTINPSSSPGIIMEAFKRGGLGASFEKRQPDWSRSSRSNRFNPGCRRARYGRRSGVGDELAETGA